VSRREYKHHTPTLLSSLSSAPINLIIISRSIIFMVVICIINIFLIIIIIIIIITIITSIRTSIGVVVHEEVGAEARHPRLFPTKRDDTTVRLLEALCVAIAPPAAREDDESCAHGKASTRLRTKVALLITVVPAAIEIAPPVDVEI
jgi:hypothetical protein